MNPAPPRYVDQLRVWRELNPQIKPSDLANQGLLTPLEAQTLQLVLGIDAHERTPSDIAAMQNVAVATVHQRLRGIHQKLRAAQTPTPSAPGVPTVGTVKPLSYTITIPRFLITRSGKRYLIWDRGESGEHLYQPQEIASFKDEVMARQAFPFAEVTKGKAEVPEAPHED